MTIKAHWLDLYFMIATIRYQRPIFHGDGKFSHWEGANNGQIIYFDLWLSYVPEEHHDLLESIYNRPDLFIEFHRLPATEELRVKIIRKFRDIFISRIEKNPGLEKELPMASRE